jgi:hypothetical protein
MKVLVACEESGTVREAFRKLGHDAWSCDLVASRDASPYHYMQDVLEVLSLGWDLLIAHPPCTYLSNSGARWLHDTRYPNRMGDREKAVDFFMKLRNASVDKIAIENPVGHLSTAYRKPDQVVQPWMFGDDASKGTCLWLKNLPLLVPTNIISPTKIVTSKGKSFDKWWYETCKLPLKERAKVRSKTFQGIADAMAEQWGGKVE